MARRGMREECDEVAAFGVKQTFKKNVKENMVGKAKARSEGVEVLES